MPALSVTFFGDDRQLEATYVKQGALSKTLATTITSGMAKTSAALAAQIELQKKSGGSYLETAAALAVLNKQMAEFGLISKANVGVEASAEARRQALLRASGSVTGSQVTGQGVGVDWYMMRKEREAMLQARARSLTGSEVTRTTGDTEKLAQLRKDLHGSWFEARRARAAIRAMATVRGIGNITADVAGLGRAAHGSSRMFGELVVIFREWAQGRGTGRIVGSMTYLANLVSNRLKMSFISFGIWVSAIALTAFIIYERFFNLKNLLKDMAFDISKIDIPDSYIAKLDRHISNLKNQQRDLNDELQKTIDKYRSAAEAAQRQSDASKEHYDHLRRMNELSNLPEYQKRLRSLEIDKQERQEEIANKISEQAALTVESKNKFAQANGGKFIGLRTSEEDQQMLRQKNAQKEAAQAFLKGPQGWTKFQQAAADIPSEAKHLISLGLLSNSTLDKMNQAGAEGDKLAQSMINSANKFQDAVKQNDILRKEQKQLIDEGTQAATTAAQIHLDLPHMQAVANQKNSDETSEIQAENRRMQRVQPDLTANQRIGAFALQMNNPLITISRSQLSEQKITNQKLDKIIAMPRAKINSDDLSKVINAPFE